MQQYQNVLQDKFGNVIVGASVAVYVYGTTTPATIYSGNGTGLLPSNTVTTSSLGEFAFYAANGRYSLSITATNFALENYSDFILYDPADIGAVAASGVAFTPYSTIAATNVQNAIQEVVSDLAGASGSSLVGFLQSGTGAQATTVQAKLRETVSVKDFGVVGDGVTDDSTAFALALAALATGVRLSLSGLTIKINQQNLVSSKSNFEIDGEGATIIAANGMTVASDKELLAFRSCTDFTVKNLTVNGNRANRTPAETAAHNIEFRSCQRFVVERVRSINAVVDGFVLNTSTPTNASTFVKYGYFLECTTDNAYRQGMSIINAYNIIVSGGAYNNTTGTSPQSGIDVESDVGAATPGNAYILIQGAEFSGNVGRGIITSAVSTGVDIWIDGCSFNANTDGAITAAATGTVISKCSFRGHTASVQGIVRFPSASPVVTAGAIKDCTFSGNTAAVPCIYVHSSCFNVSILDNKILDHANSGGISQTGTGTIVRGNYVSSAGGVGITAIAFDPMIVGNLVTGCLGRGIYTVGSFRPYIVENTVRDILSVSGGYIQSDDADAVVERNHCISATAAATTYGVYIGANSAAQSVSDNVFVNLHSTNPIVVIGSGSIKKRSNNVGGTQNPGDMGWSKFLKTDFSTVSALPSALTYSACRFLVTDASATTFQSIVAGGGANIVPVYSDGTNWRIG